MQNLDAALSDERLLRIRHPDAMCGAEPIACEAGVSQVLEVGAPAREASHHLDLVLRFGGVRVDEHALLAGERRDRLEQFARARHRESWRVGRPQPAVGGAVPSTPQCRALVDRLTRSLTQAHRHVVVVCRVHHALPDGRPHATCLERLEYDVRVVHRLHRQRRRGAGEEQLGCGEACRGTERRRRVRGLERPHAPPQPVEERKIVGEGSKERLAQVDVRLHESRKYVAAARIDDVVRLFFGPADRHDPAVPYQDVAIQDLETIVHRDDGAVADERRHRKEW